MQMPSGSVLALLKEIGANLPLSWETRWPDCFASFSKAKGWLTIDEAFTLWVLSQQPLFGDIVEIGSYTGRSTLVLANGAIATGKRVFAVDTFEGTLNMTIPKYEFFNSEISRVDGVQLLTAYRTNTWKPELVDVIHTMIGTSEVWSAHFSGDLCFAFIDGEHVFDFVVKDVLGWLPKLCSGSYACFHDFSHNVDVERAVNETIPWELWERLFVVDSTLIVRRKSGV